MSKHKRILGPVAAAALAIMGLTAPAMAQGGARVGLLTCNVSGGTGLVITSSHALDCAFRPDNGSPSEHYLGTINRFGLDVGFTGAGQLAWGVLAPTAIVGQGALQGVYTGVGGGATIGVGANGNLLIGGSGQTTSLQPLSISSQTGLNVTAGVGQITLEYVSAVMPRRGHRHRRHHG